MSEEARNERRVLVAVDEGEESMYALSWTLSNVIVQNSSDTLILLYVKPPHAVYTPLDATGRIDDPETPGYLFSSDIRAAIEKYSQEVADCVLEKAKKLCKDLQNVKVETRVESGDPRDVICDMSQKLAAHLLVMGTHGYGLVKRAFIGSVSNYCSQNVKCPVLIVKKQKPSSLRIEKAVACRISIWVNLDLLYRFVASTKVSSDKTRVLFSRGVNHNVSANILQVAKFKVTNDLGKYLGGIDLLWEENQKPLQLIKKINDPIPTSHRFKVVAYYVNSNGNWKVAEMVNIIPSWLLQEELVYPCPKALLGQDVLVRGATPDGVFTIKYAYNILANSFRTNNLSWSQGFLHSRIDKGIMANIDDRRLRQSTTFGVAITTIWHARNELVFSGVQWDPNVVASKVRL
ncbi:hypothetical protein VNO78_18290 [Psophocarpus tetragonolobus]|uniref:UspA domain-containing protein n=1 Tax=Psophocarpus tetragonolobus TaxID=3891 RepID=A0AAN9XLX2_PSOTE